MAQASRPLASTVAARRRLREQRRSLTPCGPASSSSTTTTTATTTTTTHFSPPSAVLTTLLTILFFPLLICVRSLSLSSLVQTRLLRDRRHAHPASSQTRRLGALRPLRRRISVYLAVGVLGQCCCEGRCTPAKPQHRIFSPSAASYIRTNFSSPDSFATRVDHNVALPRGECSARVSARSMRDGRASGRWDVGTATFGGQMKGALGGKARG